MTLNVLEEALAGQKIERVDGLANNGLATLADTKLSLKELLKAKYNRDFLERYLKDMAQFDLYNNALRIHIDNVKRGLHQEINEINDSINALVRQKGDHSDLIEQLRDAKDNLKSAKSAVDDAEKQRKNASTVEDLEDIARDVEQQTQAANQASQNWRKQHRQHERSRHDHDDGPDLHMGRPGGGNPNDKIKARLTELVGKSDGAVLAGLTALHDRHGYSPVARGISERYDETGNNSYLRMGSALDAIAARRNNDDTPRP